MLALLYDVHGNLPALEGVVEDARRAGADEWLLGGDYALFGGWPRETLALLDTLTPARWIRGNGERWSADPASAPDEPTVQGAIAALRDVVDEARIAALAALPESADLGSFGRAWHASPVSDVRSFQPEPQDEDAELLDDVQDRRLIFGHTHLPFQRLALPQEIELLNPGSVGMPLDGNPRASYALVHDDGAIEPRRVRYDHASAARRVREAAHGDSWGEVVAKRIERAQFVVR